MISMSGELYFLLSETIVFRKTVDTGGTSAFKGGPHPSVKSSGRGIIPRPLDHNSRLARTISKILGALES